MSGPAGIAEAVARLGPLVRVLVAGRRGSAPREAGAAMLVHAAGAEGTIGGGTLEWQAEAEARALLAEAGRWRRRHRRLVLGPDLGQCCGGAVDLVLERFAAPEAEALAALDPAAPFARPLADRAPPAAPPPALARAAAAARGPLIAEGWLIEPPPPQPRAVWI
ncbi:MAG: xanthine dehydrogenase accessory protein XdhC, partial [Alphaproteobacteria bacterium]